MMRALKTSTRIKSLCLGILLGLSTGSNVYAAEDNDELTLQILGATALHNPAFGFSLAAKPPASLYADGIVFAANILQKRIPAVLTVPGTVRKSPNTDLEGEPDCGYEFYLPQSDFLFSDLFGVLKLSTFEINRSGINPRVKTHNPLTGLPDDWGDLGTPFVFHQNAEVRLTANNRHIALTEDPQTVFYRPVNIPSSGQPIP